MKNLFLKSESQMLRFALRKESPGQHDKSKNDEFLRTLLENKMDEMISCCGLNYHGCAIYLATKEKEDL